MVVSVAGGGGDSRKDHGGGSENLERRCQRSDVAVLVPVCYGVLASASRAAHLWRAAVDELRGVRLAEHGGGDNVRQRLRHAAILLAACPSAAAAEISTRAGDVDRSVRHCGLTRH